MEPSTKPDGARLAETAVKLLAEWCDVAKAAVDEAEKFVREKPVAGAAAAFVAGWILGSVFRR